VPQVWPILAVENVRESASWYETLLSGVVRSELGNADFEQILGPEGEVMVCLHQWVSTTQPAHHLTAALSDPQRCPTGHGLLLWFIVEDFDEAWSRAQDLKARIVKTPSLHRETGCRAFVVQDLDGYHVAVNESRRPA
jgi:hypothetical protein